LKNYFEILELTPLASEHDIRRAYRRLAKQHHPDINPDPRSRDQFIMIHEAYEFLMEPSRRVSCAEYVHRPRISQEELERRERIYKVWVEYHQDIARKRAEAFAKAQAEQLYEDRWYKLIMRVNMVYNLLFLVFCLAVIVLPIYKYFADRQLPESRHWPFYYCILPIFTGLLFACFSYYQWFVVKNDDFRS
jgi:curved DNA-binding protein CbpA